MMKKIFNRALMFLAAGFMLGACEKNAIPEVAEPLTDGARVKYFFHVEGAPRANFYLDNQKVTAVAPTETGDVLGNAYGSVYPSNAYAIMPTGTFTMSAIDTVTSPNKGNADILASTQVTLENGKNYSAYLVGTIGSYETFLIEDKLPPASYTQIWWRFVNTMANLPFEVDAYAVRDAVPASGDNPAQEIEVVELGKNIGFKEHGEYKELKSGRYTFKVYESGSVYDPKTTAPFLQHIVTLGSLGRVYTTQIRGAYTATPKTNQIDYWRER